jgi:mono/diheme cytochrome c family protein
MRKALLIACLTTPLAVFLAMATVWSPQSSQAQTPKTSKSAAVVHAGQDIFSQKCLQCHTIAKDGHSFGPSLYGVKNKMGATEIRTILKNGKGKMPAFKDKLTPQQTDNLLAYLHTL